MSNYPDDFNDSAHDERYNRTDCLVDDWHKARQAIAIARRGAAASDCGDYDAYTDAVEALNQMREDAFDECPCGRCENSNNFMNDGASIIDAAMVSA